MRKKILSLMMITLMTTMILGFGLTAFAATDDGNVMYRVYNPNTGEHFYTMNPWEVSHTLFNGWKYEGAGFIAPNSGMEVYRMYNPNTGDHHYTTNAAERDMLVNVGWNYEQVAFNTNEEGYPVYRLYNPNAVTATHHYTLNTAERDYLVSLGWKDEGISWYSLHNVVTENIIEGTCRIEGHLGTVRCLDADITYEDVNIGENANNHKNIQWQEPVWNPERRYPGGVVVPAGWGPAYWYCADCNHPFS